MSQATSYQPVINEFALSAPSAFKAASSLHMGTENIGQIIVIPFRLDGELDNIMDKDVKTFDIKGEEFTDEDLLLSLVNNDHFVVLPPKKKISINITIRSIRKGKPVFINSEDQ